MFESLRLTDRVAIAYTVAVSALMAARGLGAPSLGFRLATHAAIVAGILLLAHRRPGTGALAILRAAYPLPLLLYWWGQLEFQIPLLWGSYWATDTAVAADLAIFGGFPTVQIQALMHPVLDELMAFSYLSYYLFLATPILLIVRHRLDDAIVAYGAIVTTYALNFALFIGLPAKSPPQIIDQYPELVPSPFTGFVLGDLVRSLQATDSVTGAAFPSSHIAGSMVCTLVALRFLPRLGRLLAALLVGMSVATVYLGYHHAVDPIAGLALGALGYWLAAQVEPLLQWSPGD